MEEHIVCLGGSSHRKQPVNSACGLSNDCCRVLKRGSEAVISLFLFLLLLGQSASTVAASPQTMPSSSWWMAQTTAPSAASSRLPGTERGEWQPCISSPPAPSQRTPSERPLLAAAMSGSCCSSCNHSTQKLVPKYGIWSPCYDA